MNSGAALPLATAEATLPSSTSLSEIGEASDTIGTNNGITQTQAHLCMFPAFPQKAHKSNQTWLRSRQKAHIAELAENMNQAEDFNDYKTVWQRARDIAGTALD